MADVASPSGAAPPPVERRVRTGAVELRCRVWGDAAAPAALLVHGAGMHARWWDPVVPALVAGFRLVVPDLRGHGESDRAVPPRYQIEDFADDLRRLLDALAPGPIAILGHSMGGRVSAWLAAELGERVWALGLLDTRLAGLSQERVDAWRGFRPRRTEERVYATREEALAAFRVTPDEPGLPATVRAHLAAHAVVERRPGEWALRVDRAALGLAGSRAADLTALAMRIRCPTLIVRGAASTVIGEAGCRALAAALPDATLQVLPGGHHGVPGHAAEAGRVLRRFLDRAWAARAAFDPPWPVRG